MTSERMQQVFKHRRDDHIAWLAVGPCLITADEARELEAQGYGELRGGDSGVFWLYPVGGKPASREVSPSIRDELRKQRKRTKTSKGDNIHDSLSTQG